MKLEDLKSKEIESLNEILGGDSGMGMNEFGDTMSCSGGCQGYYFADGSGTLEGNTITLD